MRINDRGMDCLSAWLYLKNRNSSPNLQYEKNWTIGQCPLSDPIKQMLDKQSSVARTFALTRSGTGGGREEASGSVYLYQYSQ